LTAATIDVARYQVSDFRHHIAAALRRTGDHHTYEDVAAMIADGDAQFWPYLHSCVVTEVLVEPDHKRLHFFLAAGRRHELEAMQPVILEWGRSRGCTRATLVGRKGWQRSFLAQSGWTVSPLVLMERGI